MDLFEHLSGSPRNILPHDGMVYYHGPVFSQQNADQHYKILSKSIAWEHDRAIIFDKEIETKRKVAWYGDQPFSYTYSKITKVALPWTNTLLEIKKIAENHSGARYNACLLNLYHDGSEGMAWHSDGEKDLKKNGAIASLSFGAERKFSFKHKKTKKTVSKYLEHGSLLVMQGDTQSHWLHRLPPSKTIHHPRINLTFRTIAQTDTKVSVHLT